MNKLLLLVFFAVVFGGTAIALDLSEIRIRDPFILADEESKTYYMYAQMQNRLNANKNNQGVEVYKSKDLQKWSKPKSVFKIPDGFWADRAVWAPEVHKYENKYYLFVTFTSRDTLPPVEGRGEQYKRGTQILVADKPSGPFKPFYNCSHTPQDWMALDGTLWIENHIPYMIFCHEWLQVTDGTMDVVQLKSDLSDVVGTPMRLFKASDAEWVKPVNPKENIGYVTDGCFLYKTKKDKLLMIWSSFGEEKYAIGIVESATGSVLGPWKHQKELLFTENGGHGMIFKTFDGKLMLVFHQPNKSPEERAQLFELEDTGKSLIIKK